MDSALRASLNWLHTWAGLVLGGLLFTIFWTGTLSVFDHEIDRWMAPASRLPPASRQVSLDELRKFHDAAARARAPAWSVTLPSERLPVTTVAWREQGRTIEVHLDPSTGARLPDFETHAGTGFLFPFHYMLHIEVGRLGQWLVGAAGLAMLALCVSGIVIHRQIFADFFRFRAAAKPRRWMLDMHTIVGVSTFPFIVAITISGLSIAWPIYFPGSLWATYGGSRAAFNRDAFDLFDRPRTGRPAGIASLDRMEAAAGAVGVGGPPRSVTVWHPGDSGAYVQIARRQESAVGGSYDRVYFDAPTGSLLHRTRELGPVLTVDRFVAGLHEMQFRHWTLRWLGFLLGLAGCVLIATGHLFWLESRRKRHAQLGLRGVRFVEGLTIGSVTGIVAATFAFFVVNRLLPFGASLAGYDRASLEVWTFYLVWFAGFVHAWLRTRGAWREQCLAIAGLGAAAVLFNWLTTGDHLGRSLLHRHLWAVAGMDLLLLAGAAVAILVATHSKKPIPAGRKSRLSFVYWMRGHDDV